MFFIFTQIIFNYITGCLGVFLFQDLDPFHFGSVQQALFTIYQIETLDNWDMVRCACFSVTRALVFLNSFLTIG